MLFTLRRRGAALALASLAAPLLAVAVATPASAAVPTTAPALISPNRATAGSSWAERHASLTAAPEKVLAAAPKRGPIRIVTVHDVDGRPQIDVDVTQDRAYARDAVVDAQQSDGALSVSVDVRVHVAALANDLIRSSQWGLTTLGAELLWAQHPGNGVKVAVVDTGVQADHPDLAGVVGDGIDYVDTRGDGRTDANGHGTHVAGIIGAVANNGIGVAGLAQGVDILPVRVLDAEGGGWSSDIAKGITWAADNGAAVINLSLGGGSSSTELAAVRYAQSRDVVVVAAAGNERQEGNPVSYPAAYDGVIGVAASDKRNAIASFSNTGAYVDVTAPGVDIASTYPTSRYAYLSGTSMATPFVAATAALLKAAEPTLTPAAAQTALESTARDLAAAGRDDVWGYGLIDPAAAVASIAAATPAPTPAPGATTIAMLTKGATVRYGSTIAGAAQVRYAATRAGVAHAAVEVCVRPALAAAATCRAATADRSGHVTWRLTARTNTTVHVTFPAATTAPASTSPTLTYTVVPKVRTTRHGSRVVVRIVPGGKHRVVLQRWTDHRWATARAAWTSAAGHVTFKRVPRAAYRVRISADRTVTAAVTARFRVP